MLIVHVEIIFIRRVNLLTITCCKFGWYNLNTVLNLYVSIIILQIWCELSKNQLENIILAIYASYIVPFSM